MQCHGHSVWPGVTDMITHLDEKICRQSNLGVTPVTATTMPSRSVSIDYLRAFVIFLVVAFHSALAYLPYAPAPQSILSGDWRLGGRFL